ncbi:hypothetical protein FUAX_09050 [Fulvitalea axinellae]|uniref:DUF975 family protein n=1 Tax=Fulvitalea axinellae TaxID=1182444 RepID=A0AAU9CF03_9BACT|nr:hypothetical protein FUAX_09050 [Fulvitalea axinellae]
MIEQKIEELRENGYTFDFMGFLREGFGLFKAYFFGFISFTALAMLIFSFIAMTGALPLIYLAQIFVMPLLVGGIVIVCEKIRKGQEIPMYGDFFGVRRFAGRLISLSLVEMLITFVAGLPALLYASSLAATKLGPVTPEQITPELIEKMQDILVSFSPQEYGIMLALALPVVYLTVAYMLAQIFVVVDGKGVVESLKLSRRLVHRDWFSFLGLAIIFQATIWISSATIPLLTLFFIPMAACVSYAIYMRLLHEEEEKKEKVSGY